MLRRVINIGYNVTSKSLAILGEHKRGRVNSGNKRTVKGSPSQSEEQKLRFYLCYCTCRRDDELAPLRGYAVY